MFQLLIFTLYVAVSIGLVINIVVGIKIYFTQKSVIEELEEEIDRMAGSMMKRMHQKPQIKLTFCHMPQDPNTSFDAIVKCAERKNRRGTNPRDAKGRFC